MWTADLRRHRDGRGARVRERLILVVQLRQRLRLRLRLRLWEASLMRSSRGRLRLTVR